MEQLYALFSVLFASTPGARRGPEYCQDHLANPVLHPAHFQEGGKEVFCLTKGFRILNHLPVVVSAANKKDNQGLASSTSKNKEAKKLDFFGCKIYSMASLQFRVENYQALLRHYNFNLWNSLFKFKDFMSQEAAQELEALVDCPRRCKPLFRTSRFMDLGCSLTKQTQGCAV